ncbi:M56 family metallopeptidase [Pseudarthrobacter sp. H3Y2-7]|jgi:Zn-dependent protease with chaperone function|uniref:M56 family metallopeptidase n=1 Tax=Pseudarthrobacter TaxID=1742993 RepID=UPI0023B07E6C|nr:MULTISPECIES: M56 family metallopeptidase [unclassified Pseudarthrobacter]MDE8668317.1 M56 family metallopeptidase [Pseudarthrobacter sp. H3Y2-7]
MFWTSYLLAVLAIVLAWPVPIFLSRAQWPARSPFTAMLLWQAIALAGGLSMIGAMLVYGLEPVGENLIAGLRALAGMVFFNAPTTALGFWHLFALSAAALLTAHLVFTLLLTYYKIRRQRRRHRELLDLLASPSAERAGTVVISHDSPVAYCLPGGARSVTVLSDGLMAALEPDELRAVLSHENAHLNQRHHLLLWAFAAWRQALPWLPTTRLAQESVNSLIEMLADDVALKTESRSTLIKAIAIVASGSAGARAFRPAAQAGLALDGLEAAAGVTGSDAARTTASRVSRLLSPRPELPTAVRGTVLAGCTLLLALPTALLIVPGLLG